MKGLREKFRKNSGFTLIEMLIVVAIIAILIMVSIPLVTGALEKTRDATDQANERAAKAEATMLLMEVIEEPTGATTSGDTITCAYDALTGGLVGEASSVEPYGQCRNATNCYTPADGTKADHNGKVIQVVVNRKAGTVELSWVNGKAS